MIEHVDNKTVSELFSAERPSFYFVPKYQREYVWGKDDWDALFSDLIEEEAADGHFLGTFICVNQERDSSMSPRFDVIDGQQRLTTLSLLLAAIYTVYVKSAPSDDDEITSERLALKKALAIDGRPRLTPQIESHNRDDFFSVISDAGVNLPAEHKSYRGVRRIEKAYKHFRGRIEEMASQLSETEFVAARDLYGRVKRAQMVKLEVNSYSDAFTLFESLNNRGRPLTPIDLIKNSLLAKAESTPGTSMDDAYNRWQQWLEALGDDYATQERFFRQFYNSMKDEYTMTVKGAPIALRSNLIRIYEDLIGRDVRDLIEKVSKGTSAYSLLTQLPAGDAVPTALQKAIADLIRAEGTPAHILLLFLLLTRDANNLTDAELVDICRLLTSFTVRRNLTNVPATYALQPLFMEIISDLRAASGDIKETILRRLTAVSSDDEHFKNALAGRIYEESTNVVRFILVRMAEEGMTKENRQDLWARDQTKGGKDIYRWSIEHILPQSEKLEPDWTTMLGGPEAAAKVHDELVHHLGNLTLTAYNSSLGKMTFAQKRDHKDERGLPIGYRNGLNLNAELAERTDWTRTAIEARTSAMASKALAMFPLA